MMDNRELNIGDEVVICPIFRLYKYQVEYDEPVIKGIIIGRRYDKIHEVWLYKVLSGDGIIYKGFHNNPLGPDRVYFLTVEEFVCEIVDAVSNLNSEINKKVNKLERLKGIIALLQERQEGKVLRKTI
jgi:hypothetical protein